MIVAANDKRLTSVDPKMWPAMLYPSVRWSWHGGEILYSIWRGTFFAEGQSSFELAVHV